jgi:MFS family permease
MMANRFHARSHSRKAPTQVTRLRIRMFAQAIRNVGVVVFGLCGGWMLMTLSHSWPLTFAAIIGIGLFLVGYWLIPFYVDPEDDF